MVAKVAEQLHKRALTHTHTHKRHGIKSIRFALTEMREIIPLEG